MAMKIITFLLLLIYTRLIHSFKELMAEMENLRTEKVSQEESSKLAKKKFQDELAQLKAQMESLQSQVRSESDKTLFTLEYFFENCFILYVQNI